jgi:hypothetical protein
VAPHGSSSNAAQADTSRATGNASAPSARRRPATNRVDIFDGDDSATGDDSSGSYHYRRHPFTSTHPSAVAFKANQDVAASRAGARGSSGAKADAAIAAQAPLGAAGAARAPPGTTPIGNSRFTFPLPPPSPSPPSAQVSEPPFTQPRYPYVDLTKGAHPGSF